MTGVEPTQFIAKEMFLYNIGGLQRINHCHKHLDNFTSGIEISGSNITDLVYCKNASALHISSRFNVVYVTYGTTQDQGSSCRFGWANAM
jgi:hypothetical protein